MEEIGFFKKMAEIGSVTGHTEKLQDWLCKELKKMGFKTEIDSAGNVIACNQSRIVSNPSVLFCGHLDTVAGNIPVRVEKNLLYGRGSVDAKGPLAAFILAVARLTKTNPDFSVVIAAAPDEEGPSNGAKALLKRFSPQFVVIGEPSGVDGITIGYRGNAKVLIEHSQACFHKSIRQTGSGEKTIGFWNRLSANCDSFNQSKTDFERLDCAITFIQTESDGLNEKTVLKLSIRIPIGFTEDKVRELFENLQADSNGNWGGFKISINEFTPAYQSNRVNQLASAFSNAIRQQNKEPVFKVKSGTADFNLLGPHYNVPIIAYGPGDSSLDHTPNEHADLNEFLESIQVIEHALKKLAEKK